MATKAKEEKKKKKMGMANHFPSFFFIGHKQTHPACYLSNYVPLRAVKEIEKCNMIYYEQKIFFRYIHFDTIFSFSVSFVCVCRYLTLCKKLSIVTPLLQKEKPKEVKIFY